MGAGEGLKSNHWIFHKYLVVVQSIRMSTLSVLFLDAGEIHNAARLMLSGKLVEIFRLKSLVMVGGQPRHCW